MGSLSPILFTLYFPALLLAGFSFILSFSFSIVIIFSLSYCFPSFFIVSCIYFLCYFSIHILNMLFISLLYYSFIVYFVFIRIACIFIFSELLWLFIFLVFYLCLFLFNNLPKDCQQRNLIDRTANKLHLTLPPRQQQGKGNREKIPSIRQPPASGIHRLRGRNQK